MEPVLIEQHLLVRGVPEGPDLLFLAPGGKSLLPNGKSQQRFEVRGLGIGLSSLFLASGNGCAWRLFLRLNFSANSTFDSIPQSMV